MSSLVSTDDRAPAERVEYWREVSSTTFVPLEANPTDPGGQFRAVLATDQLGAVQVSELRASPHWVRRTPRLIARRDADYYKIGLQLHGHGVVAQDGRESRIGPGDFAIYDCTRPYTLSFPNPVRMLLFLFPRQLLPLPDRDMAELTAARVPGGQGMGALVSPFLSQLARYTRDAEATRERLAGNVLDLLATVFDSRLSGRATENETGAQRRDELLRVTAYIDHHLADAELTPERIARAHHMSVRSLYKLFESRGDSVALDPATPAGVLPARPARSRAA